MKGRVLAGKYRLVAELGRGGMGSVWRADHIELRSPVAVKLIDPTLAETREGQSRFLREARAAGSLRSTHVVSVFDYGVDEDTPFLVMELLEGESLATRLERRGRLTLEEVSAIIKQVARGLAKAHGAGIVHRDLKPENIFITIDGDAEVVKVLDFGIAKVESNIALSVQTQTGMVLGTPYYMSPEQAEGRRELDARSDIWSLGVIVYECLLGRRPFDGDNLAQIILAICAEPLPVPSQAGDAPPGFDAWFARAVARRLEQRFQSVQEFSDELALLAAPNPLLGATEIALVSPMLQVSGVSRPSARTPASGTPAEHPSHELTVSPGAAVQSEQSVAPQRPPTPGSVTAAHEPPRPNDAVETSSLQWSKDPTPRDTSANGTYTGGAVRSVPNSARLSVGAVMIVAVGSVGVAGWLWASQDRASNGERASAAASGEASASAVSAAPSNVAPSNTAPSNTAPSNIAPSNTAAAKTASPGESSPPDATPTSPGLSSAMSAILPPASGVPSAPSAVAASPRNTDSNSVADGVTIANAPPAVSPGGSPSTAVGGPAVVNRPVAPSAPKAGTVKPVGEVGSLYCSYNSISGRLVRSSPGKAGSFPCYVHALSGELRKKD